MTLRELIGKYEAGMLRQGTSSRKTLTWMFKALEGFFEAFPKIKRPEQILITDVEDWRLAELERGRAWNTVRRDLCAVKAFYSWLRKDFGYEVDDPVWIPPPRLSGKQGPRAQNQVTSLHPDLRQVFEEEQTDRGPER